MKILLFLLPFFFLFILVFHQDQAFTQDLGRHIKMGEMIRSCHCVPKTNLFSYTQPDHPFINHHWFSEVVFYELYRYLGVYSLLILKVVLLSLSFGIVYILAFRQSPFWACIGAIPYIYIFSERFDTRPELFSFIFISLFVFLIQKYRITHNISFLFALPFIELLWVNMHIYFVVGVILFTFLILEEFIKKRKKTDKSILILFAITGLVLFINPNGIAGALQPLTILQNYGYTIVENQNIFFLNTFFFSPHILVYEILGVLILGVAWRGRKQNGMYPTLLIAFALVEGGAMIRNFPIFVLATFVYMVAGISTLEKEYVKKSGVRITVAIGIIVWASVVLWQEVTSPMFGLSYTKGAEQAVAFFQEHQLKGRIFNNFDIGSYLIFKLYPGQKVFVDGRPEAYSPSFFEQYKRMQEDPVLFEKVAKNDQINTIFFAHTDITPWAQSFLTAILKNPSWVSVYADERIIILVRNVPENNDVIAHYRKTF